MCSSQMTGETEKTPMKHEFPDFLKDIRLTPLKPKENGAKRCLAESPSFSVSETLRPHAPQNRRFVSSIVYLLFSASFIYLVAGPWIGWDGSLAQQTLINVCGTVAVVRWPLRKYILKCAWIRRAQKWQIIILCLIPWRALSRLWGMIAGLYVPKMARPLVYGVYCKLFGVETAEMEKPLKSYESIKDFFTRRLRVDVRTMDTVGLLISPCDGTIVQCCPVSSDKYVKKVKGLDYCLKTFLGLQPDQTKSSPFYKTCLYQCVIYLAPGDYHRFHSPCDWTAFQRKHFCGQLLSVAPKMVRWLPNLLELNERAVYIGKWEHGFFSYTAVGATNVGSIIIHNDPTLETNKFRPSRHDAHVQFSPKNDLTRGQEMGLFSMGSTIVLVFEAPENFHFTCRENEKIKVGSCLGGLDYMCSSSRNSHSPLESGDTSDADYDLDYEFGGSGKVLVS